MAKRKSEDPRVAEAFHEVHEKMPRSVIATGKTGKAKQAMLTAIALSKARAAGANIPKRAKRVVHHSPTMLEVDCSKLYSMTPVRKG